MSRQVSLSISLDPWDAVDLDKEDTQDKWVWGVVAWPPPPPGGPTQQFLVFDTFCSQLERFL